MAMTLVADAVVIADKRAVNARPPPVSKVLFGDLDACHNYKLLFYQ
jgi:hypothetical protein